MAAAREHRVKSPLLESGFRKADVRALAEHWQLPVWDKPASPCLSSRVAYGEEVTPERLAMIDRAEQFLQRPWPANRPRAVSQRRSRPARSAPRRDRTALRTGNAGWLLGTQIARVQVRDARPGRFSFGQHERNAASRADRFVRIYVSRKGAKLAKRRRIRVLPLLISFPGSEPLFTILGELCALREI